MGESLPNAEDRARLFCEQSGAYLVNALGHGIDGNVWQTSRQSALKAFVREETYRREQDCYRRLFENGVDMLVGFDVPELKDYSNSLLVIEMSIVSPPCILDFGKAYVDMTPDYSPERWRTRKRPSGGCSVRRSGSKCGWCGRHCGGTAFIISTPGRAMSCSHGNDDCEL